MPCEDERSNIPCDFTRVRLDLQYNSRSTTLPCDALMMWSDIAVLHQIRRWAGRNQFHIISLLYDFTCTWMCILKVQGTQTVKFQGWSLIPTWIATSANGSSLDLCGHVTYHVPRLRIWMCI